MYKTISSLNRKTSKSSTSVKDKNDKLLADPGLVKKRWMEHTEELYDADSKLKDWNLEPETEVAQDDIGPCTLEEEVMASLSDMKNNKAVEGDEIPTELLRCMGCTAVKVFTHLCQKIYETGKWPEDFLQSVVILLEKKPNATECSDFRTISLLAHAAKVLIRILTKHIEAKVEMISYIADDQFGFKRGKETTDAIAALTVLGERSLQHGRDIYVCFNDYEKAFDTLKWNEMIWMLKNTGIDWKDRNLIAKKLYLGQTAFIKIKNELTGCCEIGQRVRQGCPLSPVLFNIYIQHVINKGLADIQEWVKVGAVLVQSICFADDHAMVSHTQRGLQRIMDALQQTSEKYNMWINVKKTKVMRMPGRKGRKSRIIMVNGKELESVTQFCYLRSIVTEDSRSECEV